MPEITNLLLKNGLDFVLTSSKSMSKDDISIKDAKYAILNLWSGILLLLKERIYRAHWALLFTKNTDISEKNFKNGDFNSIGFDQILQLTKEVCGITISKENLESLQAIRKKRNVIEHFQFTDNLDSLKSFTAQGLDFVVTFVDENLQPDTFDTEEGELFEQIKIQMVKFDEFVQQRSTAVERQLKTYKEIILCCPSCERKNLIFDSMNENEGTSVYKCLFCLAKSSNSSEIAEVYLEQELYLSSYSCGKDGEDFPLYNCEECGEESLIPVDSKYSNYYCVCCRVKYSLDDVAYCSSCGVFTLNAELRLCGDCHDNKMRD